MREAEGNGADDAEPTKQPRGQSGGQYETQTERAVSGLAALAQRLSHPRRIGPKRQSRAHRSEIAEC